MAETKPAGPPKEAALPRKPILLDPPQDAVVVPLVVVAYYDRNGAAAAQARFRRELFETQAHADQAQLDLLNVALLAIVEGGQRMQEEGRLVVPPHGIVTPGGGR